MNNSENIEKLLQEVLNRLDIIIAGQLPMIKESIKNQHLTTENRKKMYDLFNGKNSLQDVADKVGVTLEAVRLFKVVLEDNGIINVAKQGKREYPQRFIS